MANHIEDEGGSQTDAVNDLLRRKPKQSSEFLVDARYQAAMAYVVLAPTNGAVTGDDIDDLYQYLDTD